jgi:hypothetical protein
MSFCRIGNGCSKNVFWLKFTAQHWKFCVRIREIASINIAPESAYSKIFCCSPHNLLENNVKMLWIRQRPFVYVTITRIKCCCASSIRQGRHCTYTVTMRRRTPVSYIQACFCKKERNLNFCNLTDNSQNNLSCINMPEFSGAALKKIWIIYFKLRKCEFYTDKSVKAWIDIQWPNQVILRKTNTYAHVTY